MKIKVFPLWRFISAFFLILCILVWIFTCIYEDLSQLDLISWIGMGFMMGICPLGLAIWGLFTMEDTIKFDEIGVSRIKFFGKTTRHYNWENIKTIASTDGNMFSGWIYISEEEKKYDRFSITRMRLSRKVIYFHQSEKAQQALMLYAPENLKAKIAKCIVN